MQKTIAIICFVEMDRKIAGPFLWA